MHLQNVNTQIKRTIIENIIISFAFVVKCVFLQIRRIFKAKYDIIVLSIPEEAQE